MSAVVRHRTRPTRLHVVTVVVCAVLGACSSAPGEAVACAAFDEWERAGFPGDLLSPEQGPRYLDFLAALATSRSAVADDATTVHEAATEMHRIMMEDPQPTPEQTERLRDLNGPEVLAAFQRITDYGDVRCGVSLFG